MRKSIYIYAWDLLDEGVETCLERIRDWGLDEVILPVSYHAGKFILPHNPKRRVYFPEDGVVYYPPSDRAFAGSAIKPRKAACLGEGDLPASVADACHRLGLDLSAWVVCLHNSRLGAAHPELTVANAWGDRYVYALCPAQPEVSDYVRCLLEELTSRYPWRRVFLESLSYLGFSHGYHHEFYGVSLNAVADALLGLCFCPACRREAEGEGLDVDRLAAVIRTKIDKQLCLTITNDQAALEQLLDEEADLARYVEIRCRIVKGLLSEARRITATKGMEMDVFSPVFVPGCRWSRWEGVGLEDLADMADYYALPVSGDAAAVERELANAECYIRPERIKLSLKLGQSSTPSFEDFARKMAMVEARGLAGCNFYNYGTIPLEKLAWIKTLNGRR